MKHRKASPYRIVSDGKGNKVAVVEATKGYTFTLDAADWACVCHQHGRAWRAIGDGKGRIYIAAGRTGTTTPLTLARAIMNAQPGQIIRYRDGDRLNLRRNNLYIDIGRSKHAVDDAVDQYAKAA